ncbi:hypothetical protein AB0L00_39070 [Actinoallomurus sp. NPDC052308]|uniref:hypothetical protein n=1 Tax=Actinoallomurus sp. NPDC052308 TaxID=3155530 RepID=UPI00342C5705
MRGDVEAALACFRQVGDRWGQATALPMRAQLRQYDDDLDGALADLREARSLAGSVRASLCLETGDLADAERALEKAYAAALETRDLPILSLWR